MVYICVQTYISRVPIGIFDDTEEAKDAYVKYLKCHKNFDKWFEQLKEDFNGLFNNLTIDTMDDLKNIIFDEDLYKKIEEGEQTSLMEEFWEERYIDTTNIIREVSDNYAQKNNDIVDLAAHFDWSYDDVFGNHLCNLIFSLVYRSESRFRDENYIERLAQLHPIF